MVAKVVFASLSDGGNVVSLAAETSRRLYITLGRNSNGESSDVMERADSLYKSHVGRTGATSATFGSHVTEHE